MGTGESLLYPGEVISVKVRVVPLPSMTVKPFNSPVGEFIPQPAVPAIEELLDDEEDTDEDELLLMLLDELELLEALDVLLLDELVTADELELLNELLLLCDATLDEEDMPLEVAPPPPLQPDITIAIASTTIRPTTKRN